MQVDQAVLDWRSAGRHLPAILRDFHDQKDVFKLVDAMTAPAKDETPGIRRPTWVEAHTYVIDSFLWCMARHGYTLQRSRARLPFDSLENNIVVLKEREAALFNQMLAARQQQDGETHG